jgi:hypothetical protein
MEYKRCNARGRFDHVEMSVDSSVGQEDEEDRHQAHQG